MSSLDKIENLIKDSKEKSWRQIGAIKALGETKNIHAVNPLISLLDYNEASLKESYEVRWEAAKALVKLGNLSVKPLLENIQEFENYREVAIVTNEILWALGEIGDEKALDTLNRHMTTLHAPKELQTTAMNAMVKIGGPSIKYFIDALKPIKDARKYRYVLAASALATLGKPAVEPLIYELQNDDSDYQRYIIDVLGEIGDLRAIDSFIQILALPKGEKISDFHGERYIKEEVFQAIRRALNKLGKPGFVILLQALKNEDTKVRLGAARALGLIGVPSSVEALIEATKDDDDNVSYAALGALRRTLGELEILEEVKCVVDMSIIDRYNIPEKVPVYRV